MQGYCDVRKWTILKRTSPEVKCLHPTSSRREMCTLSFSYVIYHKFSHGVAFYTLNGKNVNVMLEFILMHVFGRTSVEWRNLTMNILAYRAVLAPNFVEKASLILVSIEILCGIILI